jgi:hypothetical protein
MDNFRIELDIPLKGERKYLQSASILAELIRIFTPSGALKLDFRQMIYQPIFVGDDQPDNPARVAKFEFRQGDELRKFGLFVDPSREITGHIDNNEAEILANSDIGEENASCPIGHPANFIDSLVALNKVLVGRHSKGKKAIFSAIELDRVPEAGRIGVRLVKKLGSRLFVSDVLCDNAKIGVLTFMAV